MSLDISIIYKEPKQSNYFLEHPYSYDKLSEQDKNNYNESDRWHANITHNLGNMASHVPIKIGLLDTDLYIVLWRPEKIGIKTINNLLPLLVKGIYYMIDHRIELEQYNAPNGWGTYNDFMKFLLNLKQACEDNDRDCLIEVSL